jgi:hypothetical protein
MLTDSFTLVIVLNQKKSVMMSSAEMTESEIFETKLISMRPGKMHRRVTKNDSRVYGLMEKMEPVSAVIHNGPVVMLYVVN